MFRFITALGLLAVLPAAAHASPVAAATAKVAVPAGKMVPVSSPAHTAKADSIACPQDVTKARACHLRQAELRREQSAIQSTDAAMNSDDQALD